MLSLEWQKNGEGDFRIMSEPAYRQMQSATYGGRLPFIEASLPLWHALNTGYASKPALRYTEPDAMRVLNGLLRRADTLALVVGPKGSPLAQNGETLSWRVEAGEGERADYIFSLVRQDGSLPPPALFVLDGRPSLYVTEETIFSAPKMGGLTGAEPAQIPAECIESPAGAVLFDRLGVEPPERLARRLRTVRLRPCFAAR